MKEEILKLRADGKSYREIQSILGCSKGTIAFHCGKGQKEKYATRNRKYSSERRSVRFEFLRRIKQDVGGKCFICGYKKCLAALEFHHINDDKEYSISEMLVRHGYDSAEKEAKKCQLLCANCHREHHYQDDGRIRNGQHNRIRTL